MAIPPEFLNNDYIANFKMAQLVTGFKSAPVLKFLLSKRVKKGGKLMGAPKIEGYSFGEIIIDGVKYKSDVVISPAGVFPNWWRLEGLKLQMEDLKEYLSKAVVDVLIVGTGASGLMKVSGEVEKEMKVRGIELIALPTGEACKLYNELRDRKRVMGVFHLTC